MLEIICKVKKIYGQDLVYPQTYAEPLAQLTKQSTLTPKNIEALKSMGFTFKVEAEALPKI